MDQSQGKRARSADDRWGGRTMRSAEAEIILRAGLSVKATRLNNKVFKIRKKRWELRT